jgi:hypothetical protein
LGFGAYVRPVRATGDVDPPVGTTTPFAGCVTDAIEIGPSTSVSLAITSTAVAVASSTTVAVSGFAVDSDGNQPWTSTMTWRLPELL